MTTGGFGTGRFHPDLILLFFSILKLVSFKKLNRAGRRWENSQTRPVYILFLFLFFNFNFLYLLFYFYYIKINIFPKKKNIIVVNQMIPMCEKVEVSEGMRESQHMRVKDRR